MKNQKKKTETNMRLYCCSFYYIQIDSCCTGSRIPFFNFFSCLFQHVWSINKINWCMRLTKCTDVGRSKLQTSIGHQKCVTTISESTRKEQWDMTIMSQIRMKFWFFFFFFVGMREIANGFCIQVTFYYSTGQCYFCKELMQPIIYLNSEE